MNQLSVSEKQETNLAIQMTPEQAKNQLAQLQKFVNVYLFQDVDYGTQPGTNKPTLFKSGAEKLNEIYRFEPRYRFLIAPVENWDREPALFDYTFECNIYNQAGAVVGTGVGSCNSYESKYRWRQAKKECPDCGAQTLRKSKMEYGGGYYCDRNNQGCGSAWKEKVTHYEDSGKVRYQPSEEEIEVVASIDAQNTGRVPNDDIASQKNTILKMAKKRALVDATICATRSSGLFTQDIGDAEIEVVPTVPTVPTPIAWKSLQNAAVERGHKLADVKKFCKTEQGKGRSMTEVYEIACLFFLEDHDNDGEVNTDDLDTGFREAIDSE